MKTLKDIFVSYEIALKLKEIGFDEPCMAGYFNGNLHIDLEKKINAQTIDLEEIDFSDFNNWENHYSAPTYEQVFKWFREKGLSGNLNTGLFSTTIEIRVASEFIGFIKFYDDENHYEVAREQLILKLIEIYKKSSKQ